MKKLLLSLLACVLVFAVLSATVLADGGKVSVEVSIDGGVKEVHPGDQITLRLHVNNPTGTPIAGLQFSVSLPAGYSYGAPSYITDGMVKSFANGRYLFTASDTGVGQSGSWDAFTVPVTLPAGAALGKAQTISVTVEVVKNASEGTIPFAGTSEVSFDVTHLEHDWNGVEWKDKEGEAATCVKGGTQTRTCATAGCGYTEERSVPATGHDITFGTFQWADDAQDSTKATAKVNVKCSHTNCPTYYVGGAGLDVEVKDITPTVVGATCTTAGTIKYTGTVSIDDPNYKGDSAAFSGGKWTKTDNSYSRSVTALGHEWVDEKIDWSKWDPADPAASFEVTWPCNRCDEKMTVTATVQQAGKNNQQATCEKEKNLDYTASADFSEADKQDPDNKNLTAARTKVFNVTGPALGHVWDTPTFTWSNTAEPDKVSVAVTLKCKREGGCKDGYDTAKEVQGAVIEKDITPATCEDDGTAKYTATVTAPAAPKDALKSAQETAVLPAIGHKWSTDGTKVTIEWTGDDEKGWEAKKATRTCENDETHKQEAESVTVTAETKDPSYAEAGSTTYKAVVKFPADKDHNGKNEAWEYTDSTSKVVEIPALTPATEAKVEAPTGVAAGIKDADLKTKTDALVQQALAAEAAPAGMPENVFQAIQKAGASTDETDPLTVTTNLVVEQPKTAPSVTGVDAANVAAAYEIYIEMTVDGKDLDAPVTGYITETAESISFTVPVPAEGGPIFYMMTDHGGTWAKIDSKVDGKNIVFSSKQFSNFVIVGSNSLADAAVTVDPEYAYTGAVIRPVVKVTINDGVTELKEGTDYELSMESDAVEPGEYKVTIKGIGSYTGSVEKTFTVLEPSVTPVPPTTAPTETPAATTAPTTAPAATKDPNAVPATGDETPVMLYATVLTVCAAALAIVLVSHRRREK